MADYIYLLQNRLNPAQWRAVETVREAARAHGMPVFLVGGAVRDLTSGSPVRDVDFALQGDVERLIGDLEQGGGTITGRNAALSSVYLSFRGSVRAEIGPTLSVSYPKPGQAVAQPAAILDDLRRRDFTANAMAISLNEGSYGLLLDPLNGTADIENREFRLVSPYGFIENPTSLLRVARLTNRLGWSMEERTATRYGTSKEEDHLQALPAAERGYELEEIFHEEDPVAAMEHLAEEGWLQHLMPGLRSESVDRNGIESVRDLIGQLESQGIYPDPSAVYFPLLTNKLQEKDRGALKAGFARPGFAKQIDTIEERAKELGSQLSSRAAAQPSDAWKLLTAAEPDLVLWLALHVRTGAVQAKIRAFLKDWPQMRQKLPHALMQEMRITPDLPEYEKLLDDLFFALIDGKLETPEATRAFLEPFSPPAPPQVSVRKRPAKVARGRSKKVALKDEPIAVAPDEAEDDLLEETTPEEEAIRDDEPQELPNAATGSDEEVPDLEEVAADAGSSAEDAAGTKEVAARTVVEIPSSVASRVKEHKAPAVEVGGTKLAKKAAAAVVHGGRAPGKKVAAKKTAGTHGKAAAIEKPAGAKHAGKASVSASATKKAATKKVAGVKAATKTAGAKKVAAKKVASKIAAKPLKKAAAKHVAAKKTIAKKVAAKAKAKSSSSVKARGNAPAKKSAKAAKKSVAKARGRR